MYILYSVLYFLPFIILPKVEETYQKHFLSDALTLVWGSCSWVVALFLFSSHQAVLTTASC